MARRPRDDAIGRWQHVSNRGLTKRTMFETERDFRKFLSLVAREVRAGRIRVHAFCLMLTHYHLLVESCTGELSVAMANIQREYSRWFNRTRQRDGTLVKGRFKSKAVRDTALGAVCPARHRTRGSRLRFDGHGAFGLRTANEPGTVLGTVLSRWYKHAVRTLIYTGCYGDPAYAEMTRLLVASLRGPGRYRGDIAVLTDGTFERNGQDVDVVQDGKAQDVLAIKCVKARAATMLDGERYDRILWLDADIVAIRAIAPLFAHCREGLCAGDEYPFNTLRAPSVGGALRWWERLRHFRTWGVNAGCFCLEGRLFRPYLDLWQEEIRRFLPRMNEWADQPPLNALIARRRIRFTPYPRGWIEHPPLYEWLGRGRRFSLGPGTMLLHYCGYRDKQETLRLMRAAGE